MEILRVVKFGLALQKCQQYTPKPNPKPFRTESSGFRIQELYLSAYGTGPIDKAANERNKESAEMSCSKRRTRYCKPQLLDPKA